MPKQADRESRGNTHCIAEGNGSVVLAVIDGLTFAAGIWLLLSSFAMDLGDREFTSRWNDAATGVCLIVVGAAPLITLTNAPGWSLSRMVVGIWLMTAPFVFGYTAGTPATAGVVNDIAAGAAVLSLALSGATTYFRSAPRSPIP